MHVSFIFFFTGDEDINDVLDKDMASVYLFINFLVLTVLHIIFHYIIRYHFSLFNILVFFTLNLADKIYYI